MIDVDRIESDAANLRPLVSDEVIVLCQEVRRLRKSNDGLARALESCGAERDCLKQILDSNQAVKS